MFLAWVSIVPTRWGNDVKFVVDGDAYPSQEVIAEAEAEMCHGFCGWCGNHSTDLHNMPNSEEGLDSPVYRVCGTCIQRSREEASEEDEAYKALDEYQDKLFEDEYGD